MSHRLNWKELSNFNSTISSEFNFKWQQNLKGLDFNALNTFNQCQVSYFYV